MRNIPKDEYLRCVALVLLRRMGFPLSTSPCRAPGWVGSTPDEYFFIFMATPKSSKRSYSDSDSDTEIQPSSFPHFIVLESLEDKPLSKLNPILVEKTLSGIVKPTSVKKLNNGTILVEVDKRTYADNLLKMKTFGGLKIKSYAHLSLNTSKGVVRSSELSLCTLDEIKSYLQQQGVTDVKRISIKRNEETINTNTYIFSFNKPQLPKEIKVGYNNIKVSPYIPNPLRCYNCQKFGHHETKCLKSPVCKKCGGSGSDHIEHSCNNTIKCANCQGNHPADSRDCMVWKREKEVNQIKYTNNISFPEARKIVQSKTQFPTRSYAQATSSTTETKHDHTCRSCHEILDKLTKLTPDSLPKFISELQSTLSESNKPQSSTPKPTSTSTSVQSEGATQVTPAHIIQTPKSPARQSNGSPNRGLRQSPTPRQRIQLEKTNSKNRFSVLEDEESMECGAPPSAPSSPTSQHRGKNPPQTPKPQRTKSHK